MAKEHSNTCYIFDFDDTLIKSTASCYLVKKLKDKQTQSFRVMPDEIDTLVLNKGDALNFSEFRCPIILSEAKIIAKNFNTFKALHESGALCYIISARDKPKLIRNFLNEHDVKFELDRIICISEHSFLKRIDAKKYTTQFSKLKAIALSNILKERVDITHVELYEDSSKNLLEMEHEALKMNVSTRCHKV